MTSRTIAGEQTNRRRPATAEMRELTTCEMRNSVGGVWVTVGFFERSFRTPTKHDDDCMSCD